MKTFFRNLKSLQPKSCCDAVKMGHSDCIFLLSGQPLHFGRRGEMALKLNLDEHVAAMPSLKQSMPEPNARFCAQDSVLACPNVADSVQEAKNPSTSQCLINEGNVSKIHICPTLSKWIYWRTRQDSNLPADTAIPQTWCGKSHHSDP